MRVPRSREPHRRVAVDVPVQRFVADEDAVHGDAGIDGLQPVRHHPALEERQDGLAEHPGVQAEVAMARERAKHRVRDRADAELQRRAVGDQPGDVRADLALHLADARDRIARQRPRRPHQRVDPETRRQLTAVHPRHALVDLRQHDPRAGRRGQRIAVRRADRRHAVDRRRKREHHDVGLHRPGGEEPRELRVVARHDLEPPGAREAEVRRERAVARVAEPRRRIGRESVRIHRPDEDLDRAELRALRHQRLGERQRLGGTLRNGDGVAGTDEAGEVERCRVELDRHPIARSARSRAMSASP